MTTQKTKIIRVTTHDISLNGLLKGQLRFLNQHFDVVGVAADTGELDTVREREGVRVVNLPMHREISLVADLRCLLKMYRLLRRERPDIVHANTPKGSLLAMVAGWAARVPHRIYTVTGLRYQGASGNLRRILQAMERLSCRFATDVIPEGEGVKRALEQDGITRKPLSVVHNGNINGIDTAYFSPDALCAQGQTAEEKRAEIRSSLRLAPSDFAFIFIGRIVTDKGMNELAASLQRLEGRAKLILVGNFETSLDPLPADVEHYLKNSPDVRYVGYQTDVRPYLLAADALAFPSYREGFPNVVLQAGAMGLPAIVTDINGCNEIITERHNGTIIPPRNADDLYNAMQHFLTHPDEVRTMAANARQAITARYEQKDVWQALLKRYEEILSQK